MEYLYPPRPRDNGLLLPKYRVGNTVMLNIGKEGIIKGVNFDSYRRPYYAIEIDSHLFNAHDWDIDKRI